MTDLPQYAWKRRLDKMPEDPGYAGKPPFEQILETLPSIWRFRRAVKRQEKEGRTTMWKSFSPINPGPVLGPPIGGIGGGTIGRGWRGEFNRFQLQPGVYNYQPVWANQFAAYVQKGNERPKTQVLYPEDPGGDAFAGWKWDMEAKNGRFHVLYPRAWWTYKTPDPDIKLTCRQVSPVIPHNYKESSTPAGAFVWAIENTSDQDARVGMMFTFHNGTGTDNDRAGGHSNHLFEDGDVTGVELKHAYRLQKPYEVGGTPEEPEYWEDPLAFAIGAKSSADVEVTYRTRFLTSSSGMDVWADFQNDGKLDNNADDRVSHENMSIGAAVAAQVSVPAGETREIVFGLGWDMPIARFQDGRGHYRRYTRFYGREGNAAPAIVSDAVRNVGEWEEAIDAWQQPILDDPDLPDWYKAALFNELYYVVEGGTIWTDGEEGSDPVPEDDPNKLNPASKFGYLEGHEYAMYNTYDVHFYASFALAMLWPEIELSIQRDFAASLQDEDDEVRKVLFDNVDAPRNVAGSIPHDLGAPNEDPWHKVNAYDLRDVTIWKDLNPKFVLQSYRDYVATGDEDFLREMWPAMQEAIAYAEQFDADGDGMIDNDNMPDQTYDTWVVSGPSAYCGGLWIACLLAAAATAEKLGETEARTKYQTMAERAQVVYEDELWNGEYYDYDVSSNRQSTSIMADQMAGAWYAMACGLSDVAPPANVKSALQKVFDFNVMQFENGEMGAVNGMRPDGRVDTSSEQSQEVWTGVTYAVAAAMIQAGLVEEGFKTAEGIPATSDELGYWFATPEAWKIDGSYRALCYMRPLAIWAMHWAYQRLKALDRQ